MGVTFNEIFRNPTPDVIEAVEKERNTGLEELELLTRGLISLKGGQPDSPALPADDALRGDNSLTSPSESEVR